MNHAYSRLANWNTKLSSQSVELDNVVYLDEFRQSQSYSIRGDWQSRKVRELESLAEECMLDKSDFDELSAFRAKEFIESLPFDIELPAIGVEDSGNVLLEWFLKPNGDDPTIFSVVFGRDNYIYSLTTPSIASWYGAMNYSEISSGLLIKQIRNHFEISPDHARLEAR